MHRGHNLILFLLFNNKKNNSAVYLLDVQKMKPCHWLIATYALLCWRKSSVVAIYNEHLYCLE